MSKKLIFLTLALVCAYFIVFFFSSALPRPIQRLDDFPLAIFSLCEENDLAILVDNNNRTLCKNSESIYIRDLGKKHIIKKIDPADTYFSSSFDLILFFKSNELVIEQFQSGLTLKELYRTSLDKDLTPIAAFFLQTETKKMLFLTAKKEAKTPKDSKTVLFQIDINNDGRNVNKTLFISPEMLVVVDIFDEGKTILLKEMFPFLISKRRLLHLDEISQKVEILPCPDSPIIYAVSAAHLPNYCTLEEYQFLLAKAGTFIIDAEKNELHWQKSSDKSQKTILSQVYPKEWQLIAKYSTRIGKRVYNCFDFSESLQITLRTCIPEL